MTAVSDLAGKTILVTGATGFIGRHVVRQLEKVPGASLVLLTRRATTHVGKGPTLVAAALEDLSPETWRKANIERVHVVLHLGGFTPKTRDTANRLDAVYRDNLMGTRALLDSLPSVPDTIVFSSTADVYATLPDGLALDETSPLGPASLYASSKLFCEHLVRLYARSQRCRVAILRYGHIFGPGEEAYGKLIPHTIRQLLRGEAPCLYADGKAERDLLFVGDAVEATLRAAVSHHPDLGPINIVRGTSQTAREIVEMLVHLTGFRDAIRVRHDQAAESSVRFDNRHMRETLGIWNLVSLEDGLRQEVEHAKGLACQP